jgi:hypothetical protein
MERTVKAYCMMVQRGFKPLIWNVRSARIMKGIRFYQSSLTVDNSGSEPIFIHPGQIDRRKSNFDYIFRPIYPRLADLLYAEEKNDWSIRCDDRVLVLYEKQTIFSIENWQIMPGAVIERFGKFILDDWNTLVFFEPDTNYESIGNITSCILSQQPDQFTLNDSTQLCIQNWDGIYWQIFDKNPTTIDILRDHHSSNSQLELYLVNYEQEFPDPSDLPLERV